MNRVLSILEKALYIIGGFFFCFTMLLMVFNVILRAAFNSPIPGAYEMTGWGASFFAAVAIPIGTIKGTHIRVDILVSKIKGKARFLIECIATVFDILFAVVLAYAGFTFALTMLNSGEATPSLGLPIGPARLLWAISAIIMVIVSIRKAFGLHGKYVKVPEDEIITNDREEEVIS